MEGSRKEPRGRVRDGRMAALSLLLLAACSGLSRSALISDGEPCRVEYHGPRSLVLVNRSYAKALPAVHRDEAVSTVKLIPVRLGLQIVPRVHRDEAVSTVSDPIMAALVTDFENLGFFDAATKGAAAVPGEFLAIRLQEGSWVLPKRALRRRWPTFLEGVSFVWSNGDRTVATASRGRGPDLREEARKLAEQNRRLREKLRRRRR